LFLATTALAEFWDTRDRIVFLGPWCTLYSERHLWSQLDFQMAPNPWDDRERFHQAHQYCLNLYEELLKDLGAFLNQVHGVQFGPRYWRILLGPWILYLVNIYYDRYVCLQEAKRLFPNFETWLLDEGAYQTPAGTLDLTLKGTTDLYNLQLYSQIFRSLGHTFPVKKISASELAQGLKDEQAAAKDGLKERFKKAGKLVYESLFASGEVWIHYTALNTWQQICLALTPRFKGHFLHPGDLPIYKGFQEDKGDARQGLAHCSDQGDPFRKILLENLPCNFPGLYLEGFRPWRHRMLRSWQKTGLPKILLNAAGLWYDEAAKLLAAEMTECGGKIFSLQHGGGYGSSRLIWPEKHEREISDRFASWGWAEQEQDDKLINLPAPKLALRKRQPGQSPRLRTIFIIGNTHPRYLHRFQSYPVGSQIEKYIQDLFYFLRELGEKAQQAALYRGYPGEYGWQMTARVRHNFPNLALDDHRQSFSRRLRDTRLVVLDYPDTTLLEVMAANVPLVLFFNSQVWEQREEATRYFDSLHRVGILKDTPELAARQVQEVYDQVDEWWFSDEVQDARREFTHHFARASRKWPREWVAWLRQESTSLDKGARG
jgi:putative transferase (TIGR04331 family)